MANLIRRPAQSGYLAVCHDEHGVLVWASSSRVADQHARDHAATNGCHTEVTRSGVEYFRPASFPDLTPNATGVAR